MIWWDDYSLESVINFIPTTNGDWAKFSRIEMFYLPREDLNLRPQYERGASTLPPRYFTSTLVGLSRRNSRWEIAVHKLPQIVTYSKYINDILMGRPTKLINTLMCRLWSTYWPLRNRNFIVILTLPMPSLVYLQVQHIVIASLHRVRNVPYHSQPVLLGQG